uniref:rRNA N-glycosylase n=1 Tax=Oryza nivara TaxID=4536 RepID=A0A0E0G1P7_ORYNI
MSARGSDGDLKAAAALATGVGCGAVEGRERVGREGNDVSHKRHVNATWNEDRVNTTTHLWANPTVLRFDFVREAYHAILRTFIAFITSTSSMLRVYDIVILKIQRPVSEAPESWNMAHLIGRDGDETMLSMRDDNLYVLGFANRSGDWHAHLFREDVTPLKINDNYGSLLGAGHRGSPLANRPC